MKLAAIDIGTNSIHLVVVQADARGGFEVVDREKSMVKLGLGLFRSGRIAERAFDEGILTLVRYVRLAESRGADEIVAVATSATREAENGGEFLDRVFAESGIMPRVISGAEEARLILLGVRHALHLARERALIFDIGGGSVEIAVGDDQTLVFAESLRLGVLRLFDWRGDGSALSPRELRDLEHHIESAAAETVRQALDFKPTLFVGTSGTIKSLGEAAAPRNGESRRPLSGEVVSLEALDRLRKRLVVLEMSRRSEIPGINAERAHAIHLGAILLVKLLELAGAEQLTLCDAALREGVIVDYLEKHGGHVRPRLSGDPRWRSVVELMRKYDRDDPRERHVAALAQDLFDRTHDLHGLNARARELLEYAALLSGVGQLISHHDRHLHAEYIVKHSALRGFSEAEVTLLGLVLRYQRGPAPRRTDPGLRELTKSALYAVRVLSGLLRVALAADRGHTQVVKGFACRPRRKSLELTLIGSGDHALEHWAVARDVEPLGKALHRQIRLVPLAAPA